MNNMVCVCMVRCFAQRCGMTRRAEAYAKVKISYVDTVVVGSAS